MKKKDEQAESIRLRTYYSQLSEEELIELGSQYESLTETAKAMIRAEFDKRGLPAPELVEPEDLDFQLLVTIQRFRDLPDAQLAKAALESAGICAFLRDENIVRVHWAWSNLLGGVRVQVRPEDQAAAEEVLSQPIPPAIESDGTVYKQPQCPSCQSLNIHFADIVPATGIVSVFSSEPLLSTPRIRVCHDCGQKWIQEQEDDLTG